MHGCLGEKIGEGAYSDVHAWAPGEVVKLFKPGFPVWLPQWEAGVTRAVFAAGCPAAEVLGEVTVGGRPGIVLRRLEGPSLLQLVRARRMAFERAGAILAALARGVHHRPPPSQVPVLRESLEAPLRRNPGAVPGWVAASAIALAERLGGAAGLCHGDLHPGNVIMSPDGPRLVDWLGVVRAPPGFDLACCRVLLTELAPETADDPQRPRAVHEAARAEYARLAGLSPAALDAMVDPWLPLARLRALLGPAGTPALRQRLLGQIEAALAGMEGTPA